MRQATPAIMIVGISGAGAVNGSAVNPSFVMDIDPLEINAPFDVPPET